MIVRLKKEEEPESWKKLHAGGIEGIRSQHVKVMMKKLPRKHPEWQEDRHPMSRHASVVRPTMYLASMDMKTAIDVIRQSTLHESWRSIMSMVGLLQPFYVK